MSEAQAEFADVVLPLVPGLTGRLQQGIGVADVGCGSGHALNLMAETFPRSRFTGFDLSDAAIAAAREEAKRKGLANVRFERRDAAHLGEAGFTSVEVVHRAGDDDAYFIAAKD